MLTSYLRTLRGFNADIRRYLLAISLIGFTVDGGMIAVVFNLYLLRLGYGPDAVGAVNSVGLIAFAINSMVAGALGQRWGNRRAMMLGLGIMMLAYLLLPLVEFLPGAWWTPWLFGTSILANVGISTYFVNTAPYLMAVAQPQERTHAISIQSALIALAAFVGSLIGGALPALFSGMLHLSLDATEPYRYTLLLAALTINVGIFVLLGATDEARHVPLPPRPRRTYASVFRVPRLRMEHLRTFTGSMAGLLVLIAIIRSLQVAGMGVTSTFFNVYLDQQLGTSTGQIGLVTGLARLVTVPVVLLIPLLAARWGNQSVAFWAGVLTPLCMLPLALVPDVGAAGLSYLGIMATGAIRYTAFMVFTMEMVKPHQRSLLSGISEMTAGVSFAIMSWWGGHLIVHQGFQTLFLVGAAGSVLGALVYWATFGPRAKRSQPLVALES